MNTSKPMLLLVLNYDLCFCLAVTPSCGKAYGWTIAANNQDQCFGIFYSVIPSHLRFCLRFLIFKGEFAIHCHHMLAHYKRIAPKTQIIKYIYPYSWKGLIHINVLTPNLTIYKAAFCPKIWLIPPLYEANTGEKTDSQRTWSLYHFLCVTNPKWS